MEGERWLGEGRKGRGKEGGKWWEWRETIMERGVSFLFFFNTSKNKLERLKPKRFIIIGIKIIFKSLINESRLMVGTKTKTFENVWIKTKKENLGTKIKIYMD